ncbi:hypothetical protein CICLE_v10004095mg [Citrus x clementina]|uniref:Uncharacterized protein n=1 Tax=Citrus clementina TaxID=85681 RepID=V4SYQ8_CITCL|nr:hypothetical protein CICLE_v10004095mg [Citrus x clementina]
MRCPMIYWNKNLRIKINQRSYFRRHKIILTCSSQDVALITTYTFSQNARLCLNKSLIRSRLSISHFSCRTFC